MIFSHFHAPPRRLAAGVLAAVWVASAIAQEPTPALIVRAVTPAYEFAREDEPLLDDIQRGCFNYLWNDVGAVGRLAKDRRTTLVASLAGVGFQLSALPIGVERGWITRDQGQARALDVLRTLEAARGNRRWGVFLHFVNADTGALYPPYNNEISTVDHALFLAGAMPAATYFGGEVAEIVGRLAAATNWRAFQRGGSPFVAMGWKPANNIDVAGDGQLMEALWHIASDEERLVYFLAAGSPTEAFALEPRSYYSLERRLGQLDDMPPFVLSWNGSLFTYFFSHCWINFREFGPDDPRQFGMEAPRVDWFENSRRATLTHREMCRRLGGKFSTLSENRWGLSPCMAQEGDAPAWNYIVPELRPNLVGRDVLQRGTVAPYAAGSAIMFTPQESLAALREFRALVGRDGQPLVWRDPNRGGYALADSFNLDQSVACDDNVAIDVGPMLLAIENVRTGLIWRLFMEHSDARRAVERLKFEPLDSE
jgi:hypothetical protein